MADFVPVKRSRADGNNTPVTTWPPPRLCQRCKQTYDPRNPTACLFHPEDYAGETAQRWLDPGKNNGGGQIHFFWTCCGAPLVNSPGCAQGKHISYDEKMPIIRNPGNLVSGSE